MNIGQYLARTKQRTQRAELRKMITEIRETNREIDRLRSELNSKLPPQDSSEVKA